MLIICTTGANMSKLSLSVVERFRGMWTKLVKDQSYSWAQATEASAATERRGKTCYRGAWSRRLLRLPGENKDRGTSSTHFTYTISHYNQINYSLNYFPLAIALKMCVKKKVFSWRKACDYHPGIAPVREK